MNPWTILGWVLLALVVLPMAGLVLLLALRALLGAVRAFLRLNGAGKVLVLSLVVSAISFFLIHAAGR